MSTPPSVVYETPTPKIARLVLNRPDKRNAQSLRLLHELNGAFNRAAQDDGISVIILAANGEHFSAGHDLRDTDAQAALAEFATIGTWCGFHSDGAEGLMALEKELYLGLSERWRNIPKPTIAEVQGKAISGGLMLVWPCDLIVASDDAVFIDNTVTMGVCGAEFFNHPWELGVRRAKEMLFTSEPVTADEAHRLGMVNHVVSREQLSEFTLDLAQRIAAKPLFALKLAKEAVNTAQDSQGRVTSMQTSFALHQLCHNHNQRLFDSIIDPSFMDSAYGSAVKPLPTGTQGAGTAGSG
jgi:enoyl-CoA hydratase